MELRSGFPFNYDADLASVESGLECRDDSLALQSQREDADINVIVKRFGVTGHLPQASIQPLFYDFNDVFDYRTALEAVRSAEEAFLRVPAEIRARFSNDPTSFVAFAENPANIEELRKMGLAPKQEVSNGEVSSEVKESASVAGTAHKAGSSSGSV